MDMYFTIFTSPRRGPITTINVSPSLRKIAAAAVDARTDSEVQDILENLKAHIENVHLIYPLFKFFDSLLEVCPLHNHATNI
jgi:hypothetical protein